MVGSTQCPSTASGNFPGGNQVWGPESAAHRVHGHGDPKSARAHPRTQAHGSLAEFPIESGTREAGPAKCFDRSGARRWGARRGAVQVPIDETDRETSSTTRYAHGHKSRKHGETPKDKWLPMLPMRPAAN
jgi:hypothetical protein